jgi:S1-C subfamily serine protease
MTDVMSPRNRHHGDPTTGYDDTVRIDEPRATVPPPPPAGGSRRRSGWKGLVASATVAAVVGAGVAVPVTLAVDDDATGAVAATAADAGDRDVAVTDGLAQAGGVAAIASEVTPSVARVDVASSQGQGSGSAVVYRDGYLLTNNHVVESASEISITLPDGTEEPAQVVGTDPRSDLAVIEVQRTDLPAPQFSDAAPKVGDTAVAIGAPFGLDGSVTAGIVSALGRSVSTPGAPLVDLIQTDAPINPGNSGGALVDAEGRVMGINTAILSSTGNNNGIGFAIPITTATSLADQLIADGQVEHAFLGVQATTVDPQIAARYGLEAEEGAVVSAVSEGSPAAEAGLQQGDIIVAVDGEEVASMADLVGRISAHTPGDDVELTVIRDGEERSLAATLGEAPSTDEQNTGQQGTEEQIPGQQQLPEGLQEQLEQLPEGLREQLEQQLPGLGG